MLSSRFMGHFTRKVVSGFAIQADTGLFFLARILKSKIVVEAGVNNGPSNALISRAMELNSKENHAKTYAGIEHNRDKILKLYNRYPQRNGNIARDDSISSLNRVLGAIDLFMHYTSADRNHMHKQFAALDS